MTWFIIILAAGVMLALALFMAYVLGWANKAFHVVVDPRIEQVNAALPGANCGGCGFVGCNEYAEAVVAGEAPVNKCPVGGVSCATALANILGIELEQSWPVRAVVHCGAHSADRKLVNEYRGEPTCGSMNIISGIQGCTYGCLGGGDCERVCDFDAIHVIDGLATVDYDKCVGCGACERACPRHIISMVPFKGEKVVVVACSNHDFGKEVKDVCKVGCIGCGLCAKGHELFAMHEQLAGVDYHKFDAEHVAEIESAVEKCPMHTIIYVGKPSETQLKPLPEEDLPDRIEPDFHTTVDSSEWHG